MSNSRPQSGFSNSRRTDKVQERLVTIMIPTYLQADVLTKAIESALAQDYELLEVIVADDASPDHTRQVVESFAHEPRLRYHRNDANLGRVENYRNTLYNLARGEYVLNLDGDDWLIDSTYISQAAALLNTQPAMALVYANAWSYNQVDGSFSRVATYNAGLDLINDGNELFLKYGDASVWIPHLTAVYRRTIALEIGFYNLDIIGADTDSLLRILLGNKVAFIDSTVAVWRSHEANASKALNVTQRVENLQCVEAPYRAACALLQIDKDSLDQWRVKMLTQVASSFVRQALRTRAFLSVVHFYFRVAIEYPLVSWRVVGNTIALIVKNLGFGNQSSTLIYKTDINDAR